MNPAKNGGITSCSPFAKFFLVKFKLRYGNQSPWLDQVTEIIRAIELPRSRFYKVVKELRSMGIVEVQETKPTELPQVRYRINIQEPEVCSLALSMQPHLHTHKVDQLLMWSSQSIRNRPHQLTVPQRILMIALLEEADLGGIIRNVGFSDLAQRTGLTIRQVKNQMAKLREFHYVRASLPGGNTPRLTGKYNSVHALNLKHPGFRQRRSAGGIVIFLQAAPFIHDEDLNYFHFTQRELLLHKQKRTSNKHSGQSDEFLKLATTAANLQHPAAWRFLSWICHDLASRALSELWSELSELPVEELNTLIREKTLREWLPAYRAVLEVDDSENPGQRKALASKQPDFPLLPFVEMGLCNSVRHIALRIKDSIKGLEALPADIQEHHFQILPTPLKRKHGQFALEITAADDSKLAQTPRFAVALNFNPKKGEVTVDNITDIYTLEHSTLESTGLADPPLTCPLLSTIPEPQIGSGPR